MSLSFRTIIIGFTLAAAVWGCKTTLSAPTPPTKPNSGGFETSGQHMPQMFPQEAPINFVSLNCDLEYKESSVNTTLVTATQKLELRRGDFAKYPYEVERIFPANSWTANSGSKSPSSDYKMLVETNFLSGGKIRLYASLSKGILFKEDAVYGEVKSEEKPTINLKLNDSGSNKTIDFGISCKIKTS